MSETWNWPAKMKEISRIFKGTKGVVIQFADSLTLAFPNNKWGLSGIGYNNEEKTFLKWAHSGKKNSKLNGWYLASKIIESKNRYLRSYTAAVGCTSKYLLTDRRDFPPLKDLISIYNPQIAVYSIGLSDVIRKIPYADYIKNVNRAINLLKKNGTIPIISTLTPYKENNTRVIKINRLIRKFAKENGLPLLDIYGEMKKRKKNIFEYLQDDGVHLTWKPMEGPPTEKNLIKSGYLLRCYLTVRKAMEVKKKVLDS